MGTRIKIPTELSDKLLFEANRTCCVCQIPGKSAHIHHIDLDNSNNIEDNLVVLCLECHNEVHTKNAFGKNWTSSLLKKYKNEWIERVKIRKSETDKIASFNSVVGINGDTSMYHELEYKDPNSLHLLKMYLEKLPTIHKGQLVVSKSEWIHPSPHGMTFGFFKLIDFYEAVLVELSTFYPKGHFEEKDPRIYFGEQISVRTSFVNSKLMPFGGYVGLQTDRDAAIEGLTREIEQMVIDLVEQLMTQSFNYDLGDFDKWLRDWEYNDNDLLI